MAISAYNPELGISDCDDDDDDHDDDDDDDDDHDHDDHDARTSDLGWTMADFVCLTRGAAAGGQTCSSPC